MSTLPHHAATDDGVMYNRPESEIAVPKQSCAHLRLVNLENALGRKVILLINKTFELSVTIAKQSCFKFQSD